ncbi:MAG: site-specific DNA-methyltransferase [Phycisphaerales bacterium]|nr:site-specific DNA-methyltransferase [Phycisphaerales bacterium]
MNRVLTGDWLELAAGLPPGSIDLMYADPPFNTGAAKRSPRGASKRGRTAAARYEDSWPHVRAYIAWLRARVEATIPALRPSGVVLLHCDWRTSHHVRVMLEGMFGEDRFVNHLVWAYGLGGSSPRRFARKHDDILAYCVDPARYYFEAPRVPATSRRLAGQTKKATDVLDIPAINNMAEERTGYPTQKPLALLRVLVGAFCPPGGTVLDPCCGSGTALVAAEEMGRPAIGFDVSRVASCIARARLARRAGAAAGNPRPHRRP